MQDQSVKIVRTKQNELLLFYYEEKESSIFMKRYEDCRWSKSQMIISNVELGFSLCSSYDETLFILCRGNNGSLHICKSGKNGTWENKLLLSSLPKETKNARFYIAVNGSLLTLIYNLPGKDGRHYLLHVRCQNGRWEEPTKIAEFIPFEKCPYLVHTINDNHIMIYFKSSESTVSSREILISPLRMGSIVNVLQTSQALTDLSILTSPNRIHVLYSTRGMFSSQLVYKQKTENGFNKPRVIWEGPKMEGCILFQIRSRLWILWRSAGQAYYTASDNGGEAFESIQRYRGDFSKRLLKAEYMNNSAFHELEAAEAYVDGTSQNEILLYPDLFQNFYPSLSNTVIAAASDAEESDNEEIARLKNKLQLYDQQLSDANTEMAELSKSLSERSGEISLLNAQWNERMKSTKEEIDKLRQRVIELEAINRTMAQEIQALKEENRKLKEEHENSSENTPEVSS